jgi:hypothetical protein
MGQYVFKLKFDYTDVGTQDYLNVESNTTAHRITSAMIVGAYIKENGIKDREEELAKLLNKFDESQLFIVFKPLSLQQLEDIANDGRFKKAFKKVFNDSVRL